MKKTLCLCFLLIFISGSLFGTNKKIKESNINDFIKDMMKISKEKSKNPVKEQKNLKMLRDKYVNTKITFSNLSVYEIKILKLKSNKKYIEKHGNSKYMIIADLKLNKENGKLFEKKNESKNMMIVHVNAYTSNVKGIENYVKNDKIKITGIISSVFKQIVYIDKGAIVEKTSK